MTREQELILAQEQARKAYQNAHNAFMRAPYHNDRVELSAAKEARRIYLKAVDALGAYRAYIQHIEPIAQAIEDE